jgi:prepilin-type N-terminal cleavage/methylation domain-containing protein
MKQKGFTVNELLIVIAIFGILTAIIIPALSSSNSGQAEHKAKAFVQKMYGVSNANASCMDRDNDANGYVSCTVVYPNADGTMATIPLECAANFTLNSGCKMTMPVFNGR